MEMGLQAPFGQLNKQAVFKRKNPFNRASKCIFQHFSAFCPLRSPLFRGKRFDAWMPVKAKMWDRAFTSKYRAKAELIGIFEGIQAQETY